VRDRVLAREIAFGVLALGPLGQSPPYYDIADQSAASGARSSPDRVDTSAAPRDPGLAGLQLQVSWRPKRQPAARCPVGDDAEALVAAARSTRRRESRPPRPVRCRSRSRPLWPRSSPVVGSLSSPGTGRGPGGAGASTPWSVHDACPEVVPRSPVSPGSAFTEPEPSRGPVRPRRGLKIGPCGRVPSGAGQVPMRVPPPRGFFAPSSRPQPGRRCRREM